ncbi:MBL fold metallo-hydrolase [Solibacillus silvestris]|uniref:MBL fold metallo-hydrolase n=1 Tax=Solibacillus silvestris TaxID=76853 RepID=UPI003F7DA652
MKKRFSNLDQDDKLASFLDVFKWQFTKSKKVVDWHVPQCAQKDTDFLKSNRSKQTITWIGHSTFLIQKEGMNILTDPVWAKTMGFSKRLTEPGLNIDELPDIDVVLISHAHYDHLHIPTLKRLKGNPLYLIPEGLGYLLKRNQLHNFVELAWYEMHKLGDLEVHFVPAKHWTRRLLWDTNTSHWGGFVLQAASDEKSIYYAGDSGYFRGFKEIGERFSIHTALMPIGAYEPVWFMHPSHVTPEEAVQAFQDVRAIVFIPMHYGAFMLADDTPKEAVDRLQIHWKNSGLAAENLKVLALGETVRSGI